MGDAWRIEDGKMYELTGTFRPAPCPYRVLVTGSRAWIRFRIIWDALDKVRAEHPGLTLVHGHCPRGADMFADRWAQHRGVSVERHTADWVNEGRRAGILRNMRMVATRPDRCLAFIRDGSPGATHCAEAAQAAGIPTVYIGHEENEQ